MRGYLGSNIFLAGRMSAVTMAILHDFTHPSSIRRVSPTWDFSVDYSWSCTPRWTETWDVAGLQLGIDVLAGLLLLGVTVLKYFLVLCIVLAGFLLLGVTVSKYFLVLFIVRKYNNIIR